MRAANSTPRSRPRRERMAAPSQATTTRDSTTTNTSCRTAPRAAIAMAPKPIGAATNTRLPNAIRLTIGAGPTKAAAPNP